MIELKKALGPLASELLTVDRYQVSLRTAGLYVDICDHMPSLADPTVGPQPSFLADLEGLDPEFDKWIAERRQNVLNCTSRSASEAQVDEAVSAGGAHKYGKSPGAPQLKPVNLAAINAGSAARLRLGVTQLRALSGWAANELAVGLCGELVEALAHIRTIVCVPIISLAPFLDRRVSPGLLRHQLGLDFLLDGTVQQSGARIRVVIHLLDLRSFGDVVWAGRIDRTITDLLRVQEDLALAVVTQIQPKLLLLSQEHEALVEQAGPTAEALLWTAIPALLRLDRRSFALAGELLERSLHLDPDNSSTHAWLAQWHLFAIGQGWAGDVARATERARHMASRAVDLAPNDAHALTLAGHVCGFIGGSPDEALALDERAIRANPYLPLVWARSANAHSFVGQHREALRRGVHARQLSPNDPLSFLIEASLARASLLLGDYSEAAQHAADAIVLNPRYSASYKTHLAALGHLGGKDAAEETRARLLALEPHFSVSQALERSPIRSADERAQYAEGLRLGGLR